MTPEVPDAVEAPDALDIPDPAAARPSPARPNVVFLKPLVAGHPRVQVGDYTYYQDPRHPMDFATRNVLYAYGDERLIIGRYCCIASETRFLMSGGNHPMLGAGTYPFSMFPGTWADAVADRLPDMPSRGDTVIGNNVWIGFRAIIMPGVRVGDGAIIGAGTVVASDVPPYGVVVGNPGRVIKRRFPDHEIEELLEIAWWHWPVEAVTEHARTIMFGDVSELRKAAAQVRQARDAQDQQDQQD